MLLNDAHFFFTVRLIRKTNMQTSIWQYLHVYWRSYCTSTAISVVDFEEHCMSFDGSNSFALSGFHSFRLAFSWYRTNIVSLWFCSIFFDVCVCLYHTFLSLTIIMLRYWDCRKNNICKSMTRSEESIKSFFFIPLHLDKSVVSVLCTFCTHSRGNF